MPYPGPLNLSYAFWVGPIFWVRNLMDLYAQYRKIIVTLLTRRHPSAGTRNGVHCECDRLPFLKVGIFQQNTVPLNAHTFKPSYLLSAFAPHLSDPKDWLEFFPCHLADPRLAVEKHHASSNCW